MVADDLKLYAIRFRWAWEDITFDAKCTQWNRQCSLPPRKQFNLLRAYWGNRSKAVRAARQFSIVKPEVYLHDSVAVKAERDRLISDEPWAVEEALYKVAVLETKLLFHTVKDMYGYLLEVYGSSEKILFQLQYCVSHQNGRGKTLTIC